VSKRRPTTRQRSHQRRNGFSLIELLVVMSIIALLIGILLTALSASRKAGLKLRCISQLHEISFKFRMFADPFTASTRGESDMLGGNAFYVDDFVDSLYRIDEFWDIAPVVYSQYRPGEEIMMCPAGDSELYRRPQRTAFENAIIPSENVSLAFNRRLWRNGIDPGITTVSTRLLDMPDVPLIMDVDGGAASAAGRLPHYIAPPVPGVTDDYAMGDFWYPSYRHNGKMVVAFVGGHVLTTEDPLAQSTWRWDISGY